MRILGLNGPPVGWHDPAACLIDGEGNVLAMAEEERFTRKKHATYTYAGNAARFCLERAGIAAEELDAVAIGWDLPKLYSQLGQPYGVETPRDLLRKGLGWDFAGRGGPELVCIPHHRAHAASTFYASGFEEAAILVNDGNGEDEAISIWEGRLGRPLVRREVWPRSHSLGYLYDAVCRALGMTFLEAGKTMGLAAYGRARLVEPWALMEGEGIDFHPPFEFGPEAGYKEVVAAWTERLGRLGSFPVGTPSANLDEDEAAVQIAWSAQTTVEEIVQSLVAHARSITGLRPACLAGGVALNCSANGLLDDPVYVPPVAADAGGALGAAWVLAPPSEALGPLDPFLGPEPATPRSIPETWDGASLEPGAIVERLLDGKVGAVARGRAEVGPRALGHRSLIALPGEVEVRDRVNDFKGRELWRPLAPIATAEAARQLWHGPENLQRYMLGAATVTPRGVERIPATVHVDGTARGQIADEVGLLSEVLSGLDRAGADPVLINTSFNGRGEPIVNSEVDALRSAEAIGVDFLVVGDALLDRHRRSGERKPTSKAL